MCGRFAIYTKKEALEERFGAHMVKSEVYAPHYNASPSQKLPVILGRDREVISFGLWGFLPHWLKDNFKIKAQINARAETIFEKPMFKNAFKNNRCLILSDGFYEWDKKGLKKFLT